MIISFPPPNAEGKQKCHYNIAATFEKSLNFSNYRPAYRRGDSFGSN
ncbi:MAG: hypothetical protein LBR79_03650 [Oscillospiraceae bacterium]|nr:hypothetical protein [Oscillospiraceae bacterium]